MPENVPNSFSMDIETIKDNELGLTKLEMA